MSNSSKQIIPAARLQRWTAITAVFNTNYMQLARSVKPHWREERTEFSENWRPEYDWTRRLARAFGVMSFHLRICDNSPITDPDALPCNAASIQRAKELIACSSRGISFEKDCDPVFKAIAEEFGK